ncbi:MAG: ABC transporter substrate-binding protein, partial [Magnetococcales bacterium]|nr:ABC transporter substrate-binding protein [Magnetococcales bacterium]
MRKINKLLIIVGIICLLSLIGIYIVRHFLTVESNLPPLYITVTGNASENQPDYIMESISKAAELSLAHFNEHSRLSGRQIKLNLVTGFNTPESAQKSAREIVKNQQSSVIVGRWSLPVLKSVMPIFQQAGIPVLSLSSETPSEIEDNQWLFQLTPSVAQQSRFLANYTHNILEKKKVTIIHDDSSYGMTILENFEKEYDVYGVKINKILAVSPLSPHPQEILSQVADEIKNNPDDTVLLLALNLDHAALFVKKVRERNVNNMIIGTDNLATFALQKSLELLDKSMPLVADYTNQILMTTQIIFDAANKDEQLLKSKFSLKNNSKSLDWIAAQTYYYIYTMLNAIAESWQPHTTVN